MKSSKTKLIILLAIIVINSAFPIGYKIHKIEAGMDPSTIATGKEVDATGIEQQRKVFKNPRGLGYYYALIEYSFLDRWYLFKSLNGSTWSQCTGWAVGGQDYISFKGPPHVWIAENETDSRLLLYIVGVVGPANDSVGVYGHEIIDNEATPSYLWNSVAGSKTDDGVHNPSICIDSSGYIWVTWTDEYTNKGKQRNKLRANRNDTPYPVTAPGWETIVDIYGETGSADYVDGIFCNSGPYLRSELVPLTATADVGVVFSFYNADPIRYRLGACTLNYDGGIQVGTMIPPVGSFPIHADLMHSSVAESGENSDVFIGYKSSGGVFRCRKWDISADSAPEFGIIHSATDVDSLALSIDKNADPDMLYAFYVKTGTPGDVFYKTIDVDVTINWESTYSAGSDPNNHWTNDALAWDNNLLTEADGDGTVGEDGRLVSTTVRELSGVGQIIKVEIGGKLLGGLSDFPHWWARPVFDGVLGDSTYDLGSSWETWEPFADITNDANAPSPWTWTAVQLVDIRIWDSNGETQEIYEFKIKVTTDWPSEITIEDNTEFLDYISASYQDWGDDGDVQIIYTRQLYKTVRFWGAPPTPPIPPTIEIDYFPILLAIILCLGLSTYFLYIKNK